MFNKAGIAIPRQKKAVIKTTIRLDEPSYKIKSLEEAKASHPKPFTSLLRVPTPKTGKVKLKVVGALKRPPKIPNARMRRPAGRSNVTFNAPRQTKVPTRFQSPSDASASLPRIQQYSPQMMHVPMGQSMYNSAPLPSNAPQQKQQFPKPYEYTDPRFNQQPQQVQPNSYIVYRQ
jgi:hypothetical protein